MLSISQLLQSCLAHDEKGEPLPPIEGLISSEFMAQQGWVLDFGAQIIYKPKAKYVWDGVEELKRINKYKKSA